MDEAEVVAAIVAGDHAGLAQALDSHAAPLFSFCRSMLPADQAAESVENTFVIARVKLDGLSDPARLADWLQAVARGECHRKLIAKGELPPAFITDIPDIPVPAGLLGKILKVCTDDTATARAHRTSVAHQAGRFGHDGFPKPVAAPKVIRRQPGGASGNARGWAGGMGRGPKLVAAITAIAVAVAVTTAVIVASGSDPARTAAGGRGQQQAGLGMATSTGVAVSSGGKPGHRPSADVSLRAVHVPSAAPAATSAPVILPTAQPTAASPAPETSAPETSSSPPHSSSAPPPPPVGTLLLSTTSISLLSVANAPATGSVTLTAAGGPIANFTVTIGGPAAANVTVSPASGPIAAGHQLVVTVTGHAKAGSSAYLTFFPGDQLVIVHIRAKV